MKRCNDSRGTIKEDTKVKRRWPFILSAVKIATASVLILLFIACKADVCGSLSYFTDRAQSNNQTYTCGDFTKVDGEAYSSVYTQSEETIEAEGQRKDSSEFDTTNNLRGEGLQAIPEKDPRSIPLAAGEDDDETAVYEGADNRAAGYERTDGRAAGGKGIDDGVAGSEGTEEERIDGVGTEL